MGKKARKTSSSGKSGSLRWAAGIAVVLVVLLIGAQWWSQGQDAGTISQAAAYYEQFPTQGTRIGSPDAPVHVEEYFDFQCPYCHTASEQVVKRLLDEYVAEGKVLFTYRFFPVLGPESVLAAQAAYCATEMNAFWPYQELLMSKKGTRNSGTYSRDNLIEYARQMGLDVAAFRDCLDGERSLQYVRQAYDQGVRMGLLGVPTFVVNGQIVNLTSWEDIFRVIDRALAAAAR